MLIPHKNCNCRTQLIFSTAFPDQNQLDGLTADTRCQTKTQPSIYHFPTCKQLFTLCTQEKHQNQEMN